MWYLLLGCNNTNVNLSSSRVKVPVLTQKIRKCGAVWCSVVQCGAVWCSSVEQCGAVWSSVVQCGAVWCSEVQCGAWGAENKKWQKINFFIHWHDIYHWKAHDLWFKNLYLFLGLRVISAPGARTWKWTWKVIFFTFFKLYVFGKLRPSLEWISWNF